MNDLLKYRVRDVRRATYLNTTNVFIDASGHCYYFEPTCKKFDLMTYDVIIERCIGLKDNNGKLIYTGDVVVVPNQYPYFDYADGVQHKSLNDTYGVIEHDAVPNYVGVVEWDDENAQFVIVLRCVNPSKSGISDGVCHYFGDDENFEIIGNIHEMELEDEQYYY